MILTPHLLTGAAIASGISNPILGLSLAFLSHYFLDMLPHWEYSIKNVKSKNWIGAVPESMRIIADFSIGVLLILVMAERAPFALLGAGFGIVTDLLGFLGVVFPNKLLGYHDRLHAKTHFLRYAKIPSAIGILSQILVVAMAAYLLS